MRVPALRRWEREAPVWKSWMPPSGPVFSLLTPARGLKGDILRSFPPPGGILALARPGPALAHAFSLLLSLGGRLVGRVSGAGGGHKGPGKVCSLAVAFLGRPGCPLSAPGDRQQEAMDFSHPRASSVVLFSL